MLDLSPFCHVEASSESTLLIQATFSPFPHNEREVNIAMCISRIPIQENVKQMVCILCCHSEASRT